MKFIIDIPDEMIACSADEAIEICISEQLDHLYDELDDRLDEADELIKLELVALCNR